MTATMSVAENGEVTLYWTEQDMNAFVGNVSDRATDIFLDRERFYATAKLLLNMSTDAEVDEWLATKNLQYDTVSMLAKAGLLKNAMQSFVRDIALEKGVYDATTMRYQTAPVAMKAKDGAWSLFGATLTIGEDDMLVINTDAWRAMTTLSDETTAHLDELLEAVTIERAVKAETE